jgi:hypothetical protein
MALHAATSVSPRLARLIGVKLGLLSHRIFDQLIDPINRQLVRDGGRHSPILFQFLVEFDAFVTHDSHRICANQLPLG